MKRLLIVLAACGGGGEGAEGPPGPEGPQGPAGPQGPPGQVTVLDGGVLQGPKGDPGETGPAGPAGPAGPMGPMGPMGVTGPMGVMGPMGPMGSTGVAGATGPAGAQGVAGAQGPGGGVFGEAAATFAGYTTASVVGATIGGREKMHATCAAQFTASHLCHAAEYWLSNSATVPPTAGAWMDASGAVAQDTGDVFLTTGLASIEAGRYTSFAFQQNCDNWTAASDNGNVTDAVTITPSGTSLAQCTTSHVLACCSTPFAEKFKGYTPATTTGVLAGGRAAMHALCGTAFAGSHMCHAAEYFRANTATPVPAGGAWIDPSGFPRSGGGSISNSIAIATAGRYASFAFQENCDNWTAATDNGNVTDGLTITAAGPAIAQCTTSHVVACCQ